MPRRGMKDSCYENLEATLNRVPRYDVKVVLGDFIAKVSTILESGRHKACNDNDARLAASSNNYIEIGK